MTTELESRRHPGAGRGSRILILSASMGGGHMQVSRELEDRLEKLGHRPFVVDMLDFTPRWGRFVNWFYPWMVNRAPWMYDWVYRQFFLAAQTRAERASVPVRLATPGLKRLVATEHPELIVSTYHLAGVTAARLRAGGELHVPCVTFVTTFGVHNLWVHPGTDLYLCISPGAARHLSKRTAAPVEVCEPVVRQGFTAMAAAKGGRRVPDSGAARRALVVAGALGLGDVRSAAEAISSLPGWRPVVVCGRNERLRAQLAGMSGVTVRGWVDEMAGLMSSADVVIDNAAGSTAKEALAAGCPVVTFHPIAGHGRHDALSMQRAGLTEVVDDAEGLRRALSSLSSPGARASRVARGRTLFGRDPARLLAGKLSGWSMPPAA